MVGLLYYLNNLKEWSESEYSHPAVIAVYLYMKRGCLKNDLERCELYEEDRKRIEKDEKYRNRKCGEILPDGIVIGKGENGEETFYKIGWHDDFVCWNVIGIGQESGPVWNGKNKGLIDSWIQYYIAKKEFEENALCMISGEEMPIAHDHLKGLCPSASNAKLISFDDADNAGLRYKGRFCSDNDVLTIGYEVDQKMHNAIKWVVKAFGVKGMGSRAMACWIPTGLISPVDNMASPLLLRDEKPLSPTGYKEELKKILLGIKDRIPDNDGVCILALDAATPGRVSIPFFSKLSGSQFVSNLEKWDLWCCWINGKNGVESPTLIDIVNYAYGNPKKGKNGVEVKADDKIRPKILQELVQERSCGGVFPFSLVRNLVRSSNRLINYIGVKGDERVKNKLLFVSCSAIRKYRYDRYKEDLEIMLDNEKEDRSYQFGRLLAVMDKIEKDAATQNGKSIPIETNALRYQSMYVQNPMRGEKTIMDKLKRGYWVKLKTSSQVFYDRLIGQIHEMLSHFSDEENRKPLSEMYLLGYYLQMNAFYGKQNGNKNEITEGQEE
jgi:CRISPR-associated protein Csd1